MKIRPVGAELFHVDGRTVMAKQIAAFRNFVQAPKKKRLKSYRWTYHVLYS
jgi:hypothetical protein